MAETRREIVKREGKRERKTLFFALLFLLSHKTALLSESEPLSPLLFFCSSRRETDDYALSRHEPCIGWAENCCQRRLCCCCFEGSSQWTTTESRRSRRGSFRFFVAVVSRRAAALARPLPRRGGTGAGSAILSANASPAVGRRDEPLRLCESIDRGMHRCRRRRRQRCKLCRRRRPRGFRAPSRRARARRR